MARATLHLNQAALHQAGMNHAQRLVGDVTRQTLNRSAVLCPVYNGYLRSTGRILPATPRGNAIVGGVEYTAEYAAAVHNGRRALTIRPRGGRRFLRFTSGGRTVYAREVHQPARQARPFLATALSEVAGRAGFQVSTPRVISIG